MSLQERTDVTVPTQPTHPTRDGPDTSAADRPPASTGPPRGVGATYVLVFNDPDTPTPSYGMGWTLVGWQDNGSRRWTSSLAAHGAGAHTGPRVAKAVAVRVLAAHGLTVEGWRDDQSGDLCLSRAVLATEPSSSASEARGADNAADPALPRVRVRRLRRSPGR